MWGLLSCEFALAFAYLDLTRRSTRTALIGGALSFAIFVAALVVIFGGSTWGTGVKPFRTFARLAPYSMVASAGVPHAHLLSTATSLLSWGLAASGIALLGRRWRDPATVFLIGFCVGGLVAAAPTTQSGCAVARTESADLPGISGPWLWTGAGFLAAAVAVAVAWKLLRRPGSILVAFVAGGEAASTIGATLLPLQSLGSDEATKLIYAQPRGSSGEAEESNLGE